LRLRERYRRDLVRKSSILCCQIREHLDAALPGYAECFANFWESDVAWSLTRRFPSAAELLAAGLDGLAQHLRHEEIRFQRRTLQTILGWAAQAAPADLASTERHRIALALHDDHQRKNQEIHALERDLARLLAATPYVVLLSTPGINVVSAAEFAGEMGPITNYANARAITGRSGLRPARYQSDRVDRANGPLVRCCNHSLRAVILMIADNLILCNQHFNASMHRWRALGKDPRNTRVMVGSRFCRIAFQMVAGRRVFRHPCVQGRHYILNKLTAFHDEHGSDSATLLRDLQAAVEQLPRDAYAAEAAPLHERLQEIQDRRHRGPELLGNILPIILARLGIAAVQSRASGETDPT
jgi:hypothetical protein